jgi:hypothetical protein
VIGKVKHRAAHHRQTLKLGHQVPQEKHREAFLMIPTQALHAQIKSLSPILWLATSDWSILVRQPHNKGVSRVPLSLDLPSSVCNDLHARGLEASRTKHPSTIFNSLMGNGLWPENESSPKLIPHSGTRIANGFFASDVLRHEEIEKRGNEVIQNEGHQCYDRRSSPGDVDPPSGSANKQRRTRWRIVAAQTQPGGRKW